MHRNKFCPPPLTIDCIKRLHHISEQARRSALGLLRPINRWLTANSCSNFAKTFWMLLLCRVAKLVQCTVKRVCIPVLYLWYNTHCLISNVLLGSSQWHHILWPRHSCPIHIHICSDQYPTALRSNQPNCCAWLLCWQHTRCWCTWVDSGKQAWTCICSALCIFCWFICSVGPLGRELESGASILVYFQSVNWLSR